jgi:hypothetical protein
MITGILLIASTIYAKNITLENGWQIKGSNSAFNSMDGFNKSCIDSVWAYDTASNKFKVYSPNTQITNLINTNSKIENLTSLQPNEGFWVKNKGNCIV